MSALREAVLLQMRFRPNSGCPPRWVVHPDPHALPHSHRGSVQPILSLRRVDPGLLLQSHRFILPAQRDKTLLVRGMMR